MLTALKFLVSLINWLHDALLLAVGTMGLQLSDKQLHFWTLGVIGILLYLPVDLVFKRIARWSISALSFIYVLTFLIVLAMNLEIQQRITGRGALDFNDILAGIWGYLVLYGFYILVRLGAQALKVLYDRYRKKPGR